LIIILFFDNIIYIIILYIIEEVDPSKLIPGEFYYLENKRDKTMKAKGKFIRYSFNEIGRGKQASFIIVPSEKIKSKIMEIHYSNDVRGFPISSYKFYKPLPEGFIDRYQQKVEEDRVTAFEKIINKKKLPEDKISVSSMFSEEPEDDQTFYGTDHDKSSLGTQLKHIYGAYLLDKKTAGRRRRKTLKSRKTKSRRRR
jgi:hypothetical protein